MILTEYNIIEYTGNLNIQDGGRPPSWTFLIGNIQHKLSQNIYRRKQIKFSDNRCNRNKVIGDLKIEERPNAILEFDIVIFSNSQSPRWQLYDILDFGICTISIQILKFDDFNCNIMDNIGNKKFKMSTVRLIGF